MLSVYRAIVKMLCLLSYPFINKILMQHNKKSSFRALCALYVPDNIFYYKGVFNGNYTANPKQGRTHGFQDVL